MQLIKNWCELISMAAKMLLLVVLQFYLTAVLSDGPVTNVDGPKNDSGEIIKLKRCELKEETLGYNTVITFETSFPGNSSFIEDKPVDQLWTKHCEIKNLFNLPGNPLEYFIRKINSVKVTSGNITEFSRNFFCGFTKLVSLNLDHNNLTDSTKLGLGFNNDCSTECNCTCRLTNLQLTGNPLKIIRENSFCHLKNLRNLFLNNCELETIEFGAFSALKKLIRLNLSGNQLRHLASGLFRNNIRITELNISVNHLDVVPLIGHLNHLEDLDMSRNVISSLKQIDFINCTELRRLSLSHNRVDSIEHGTFDGLQRLEHLDLRNNRMHKLCTTFDATNLKSIYMNCLFDCPQPFLCHPTSNFYSVHLSCANMHLKAIPPFDIKQLDHYVFHLRLDGNNFIKLSSNDFVNYRNVKQLYLNNSNVYNIDQMTFDEMTELTVLNLADNHLSTLTSGLFDCLRQLQELNLSNNNLTVLENAAFFHLQNLEILNLHGNRLSEFMNWDLLVMPKLKELTFHQNRWMCDCSFNVDVVDYLKYSYSVTNANLVVCNIHDKTVQVLHFNESHCASDNSLTTLVAVVCAFILFFMIALFIFVYRHVMEVIIDSSFKMRLFNRSSVDENEGKLFDAFIAYSSDDFEFVHNDILPRFEDIDNPYRVCIHERDFPPGNPIYDNVMEAVKSSSRTIFILTENFARSVWCRFEFIVAHAELLEDRCPRMLVIVVGDIPTTLDPLVKFYLKTNTYLKWGESLFWRKLYHAMPHERIPQVPNLIPRTPSTM